MNTSFYIRTTIAFGNATERFLCSRLLERVIWTFLIFAGVYFGSGIIINIINK